MEDIYDNTIELVNSLSAEKSTEAFSFLSNLKDKKEWEATLEQNFPEMFLEIKNGLDEIKSGELIDFNRKRRNV